MKKFTLILVLLSFVLVGVAQKIETKETNGRFGKESKNAIQTTIFYSDIKTVEKEMIKLMKSYKGKVSKKKGIIFGDDLVIPTISSNTIDMYISLTDQKDGGVEVLAAFDLGGAYLNSSMHPDQFQRASSMIRDFAFSLTEKSYAGIVKAEEKKLKDAEKDFEKLKSKKESLIKENEDYKARIQKNEKEIENLSKEIDDKESSLKEMQKEFEKLKKEGNKIK